MAKTKTVYHPAFVGISKEVPTSKADEFKDMGWRFTPIPEKSAPKPVEAEEPEGA